MVLRFLMQSAVRGYYRPAHCMERPEMQWRKRTMTRVRGLCQGMSHDRERSSSGLFSTSCITKRVQRTPATAAALLHTDAPKRGCTMDPSAAALRGTWPMWPVHAPRDKNTKLLKDYSAQRVAVINTSEGRVPRRAALRSDATAVTPRSLPPAVPGWMSHRRLPPHTSGGIPNRGP